uniref:Putative transposase n=2 Tax=Candidatus Kentrum eta TaxID=2126337 RepID=A0A450VET0_9GAMM|nr:MAG: putative transposase [Candidatus Kentron sp. H]VFK04210.1 MAG: putative transposase [Candidatus Kentron sp. H]VFK04394.1 MAG: putative transposase [Candidatus Kentron sp. H]
MRGEYRHGSHTMYSIHLHIVWVTKYGKKVLKGEIANRVREIVREECRKKNVDILKGDVSAEHVHIMVSIPPHVAISRLVQHIKGKSAYILLSQFQQPRRQYWGRHMWARGYFCRGSGNVTDEVIKAYIENQKHEVDDNFRIGD